MNLLQEVEKLYEKAKLIKEENSLLQSLTFILLDVPVQSIKEAKVSEDRLSIHHGMVSAQFSDMSQIGLYTTVFAYSVPVNVKPVNSILDNVIENNLITE